MKTRAAVLWNQPGKWEITEVELDEPKDHEVRVKMRAAGLCHSDDHMTSGDVPLGHLPFAGGHEGAGIVDAVGSAVTHVQPGDHVVLSFIPSCGRCRACAGGMQSLCDLGANIMNGPQIEGTFRMHCDGKPVGQLASLSTFSEYTVVPAISCIPIPREVPFAEAALVGCGVPTGWGSAVVGARVAPGDVTIVMGVGGVGMSAVQGARHAGASHIIVADPIAFKQEKALEFGATHVVGSIEEAAEHARSLTNGQGADSAIVTVGVVTGEHIAKAFSAVRKTGTVVVTAAGPVTDVGIPVSIFELTMFQKRLQGLLFGSLSPTKDIPRLISMYQTGQLKLTELITRTYSLDQVNEGYDDMRSGRNIRGVISFEESS